MKRVLLQVFVCCIISAKMFAQVDQQDSLALVDLIRKGNSQEDFPQNWPLPGTTISDLSGVTIRNGRIVKLEYTADSGYIPETIGLLSELEELRIYFSFNLTAPLPASLGDLSKLKVLNISPIGLPYTNVNEIIGPIPLSIGNLVSLKELALRCNLGGTLPVSMSNLTQLESLSITQSHLTGSLDVIKHFRKLKFLTFNSNKFNGQLPEEICGFPELQYVDVYYSNFTFEVLECLGQKLNSPSHTFSYAHQNNIRITNNNPVLSISAGGTLANNTYKWFKNGVLEATIPADSTFTVSTPGAYHVSVTNSLLPELTLNSDTVTITTLYTLPQRDSLALVDLYNSTNGANWTNNTNWLQTGTPISEWHGITVSGGRVTAIALTGNNLSGSLPESIGNLTELGMLELSDNNLTGTIPQAIAKLKRLWVLDLSHNQLSGELSEALFEGANFLWVVHLSHNNFSGIIPGSIGRVNMEFLELQSNKFTGIAASLATNLLETEYGHQEMNIGDNQLTFDGVEKTVEVLKYLDEFGERPYYNISYTPQSIIPLSNNNPTLSVSAGGTLSNNTYTWFRDGEEYVVTPGDSTLLLSEPGTYYVEVRNAIATELVLTSEQIVITVVESGGVLPLDFVEVKANVCISGTCIDWKTTNEQNTSHFEVEVSVDGTHFKKLGNNVSSWNTPGVHTYNAVDNNPASGYNYYRIKQVDKDGIYKYSKTVSVNINVSGNILAAPNPTTGSFMLKGLGRADKISVYNLNGQMVKQWQNVLGNKQLNIASLNNGLYVIKIDYNKKQTIVRLLKQ